MLAYPLMILEEFEGLERRKGGGSIERERRELFLSTLERETNEKMK
jgi:hypothetical protein